MKVASFTILFYLLLTVVQVAPAAESVHISTGEFPPWTSG